MKKLVLYPTREVARQSYKGVKLFTVPNQNLSLQDILKRFVRRESLPVMKEGIYESRFEDLEKMSRRDPVEQREYAQSLASGIQKGSERIKKKKEEEERERAKGSPAPPSPAPPDSK